MTELIETPRPFTAAAFNQYLAEAKLMASHCLACGASHLPPRAICPKCHSDQIEWVAVSGKGTLAAFTVIYIGPTFMVEQGFGRKTPYISGIVTLEEGISISARITGLDPLKPETIQVGALLTVDFIEFVTVPVPARDGEGESKKTYLAFKAL
jgi:uncharacterized OB-fold protein